MSSIVLSWPGGEQRPIFSSEAVELLFQSSKGVPRVINTLADLSLLSGFLERKAQVDAAVVTRVTADFTRGGAG